MQGGGIELLRQPFRGLMYVGGIQTIGVGQIDVVSGHVPTSLPKPSRDVITTTLLLSIACDIIPTEMAELTS